MASVDLIELAKQNPAAVEKYTVKQIVGICGDGNLRDNSECSKHLREFLALQSTDRLAEYARFCLDEGFPKSGFVLQDITNEIGTRLGYQVQNGRYQGVVNQAGFDGLWFDGSNHIVVEVKTTDAYRINLDTVSAYIEKVNPPIGDQSKAFSLLIVVGRQDTGDLEAQVRGSRHAWSTRLISIDALIKLMFTKEEVDDKTLIERIRRILLPFEYTRVDNIVDLVFETQQESAQKTTADLESEDSTEPTDQDGRVWNFTPRHELDVKRTQVVSAFFKLRNVVPIKRTRTNFSDSMNKIGITCVVSKRYKAASASDRGATPRHPEAPGARAPMTAANDRSRRTTRPRKRALAPGAAGRREGAAWLLPHAEPGVGWLPAARDPQGLVAVRSRRPSPTARRSRSSRIWIDDWAGWDGRFDCCPRRLIVTLLGHRHFGSALVTSQVIQVTPGIVNVDSMSAFCKILA